MFFDIETQTNKPSIKAFELTPKSSQKIIAPVDTFELNYSDVSYELLTDAELAQYAGSTMQFDCEVFENYFLVAFKHYETGKIVLFESAPDEFAPLEFNRAKLLWLLNNYCVVGFNSKFYDLPIIRLALQGNSPSFLKSVSNWIIFNEAKPYDVERKYQLPRCNFNHIDLIEVAPLKGSLKLYAGRMHCKRMQDLPFDPNAVLDTFQIDKVRQYCINDLDNNELLFKELQPQIKLRTEMSMQYNIDLRSKSDAQIAEYVIAVEWERIHGTKPTRPTIMPGKTYFYRVPTFISYKNPALIEMLELVKAAKFVVNESGSIDLPKEIASLKLNVGNCIYRMGIGGLHSSEKSIAHCADENTILCDRDVTSYYPKIILNNKLFPKHLGRSFLDIYGALVAKRLEAKKIGNSVVADSIKITINGSFGKFGNQYSVLYAPDLMIQVTITGQLSLLMLIDMLESAGISVVSANTDGILIKCALYLKNTVDKIVREWETLTSFETEEKLYRAVYARDVNNYIAIDIESKTKVKGTYAEKGSGGNTILSKNPETLICNDAVINYLANKIPIEKTVKECADIRRFISVRNVTGGAEKSGQYLGKTIRWYYSTKCKGEINYCKNGNKVPNSDGAMPMMEMPNELPADLDYVYYINRAKEMLQDLGQ